MTNAVNRTEAQKLVSTAQKNLSEQRGLRPRASQNQMINTVLEVLLDTFENGPVDGSNLVVVEAPTGTGKSFGYLLPSIPAAKLGKKRIVVSTAVVSLQEQLFKKDLPALASALPVPFTYAIAKGRSRFVCPSRLKQQRDGLTEQGLQDPHGQGDLIGGFSVGGPKEDEARVIFDAWHNWETHKWDGEQESIGWSDDQKKTWWGKVTTDNHGCSGKSCTMYRGCPYFDARAKWKNADVIVANHDLVMSDLAIGKGGAILSEPESTIYIFDEAHHVPGKARDAWACAFRTDTFKKMLKDIGPIVMDLGNSWSKVSESKAQNIGEFILKEATAWQETIKDFVKEQKSFEDVILQYLAKATPKEPVILSYTQPPQHLLDAAVPWLSAADNLLSMVTTLKSKITTARDEMMSPGYPKSGPLVEEGEMNRVLGALGANLNRLQNLVDTLTQWKRAQPNTNKPPLAKWLVLDEKRRDFTVHATPTMATDILPNRLYDKAFAVVYASATLSSVGGFSLFKQKTGLSYYVNSRSLKLESPFDFNENALLVCGDMGNDPKDNATHTQRLMETLPHVIEEQPEMGTLVLFTSKSQMEQVVNSLPVHLRALCKVQYSAANHELIDSHKADVDAGRPSILVGTQSFSEGLDLPGAWCSHVIITKLPFSVPDNPIDKTLTAWLESQGRNVFSEIAVPEAAERLIQQAGRLLRREDDHGRITILDNRLVNKWGVYGKKLVEALPPFKRKKVDLSKIKYVAPVGVVKPKVTPQFVPKGQKVGLPEITDYDGATWEVEEAPF